MEGIESVVAAHLDTWNSPAGPERTEAIAALYAPDVLVAEPQRALRGHDGMEQAIADLQAQLPGTALTLSGPIQVAQDLVTYAWTLGAPDGPAVASGRDVLFLHDDDVVSLYVVIDTPDHHREGLTMTDIQVLHDPARQRYSASVAGEAAGFAEYILTDDLIVFTHTEVDPRFEGKGIGSAVARFALDDVKAEGQRKVMPLCPFVKGWIGRHLEYAALVYGIPESTAKD
ncbi:GNAT family N-acetyltransferase [Aeromicrobium duanguangcaii]|uniref:GNAT family N-acetyltransferase n=1 Tax=Aeromicrobium duanguangcaii TaxID=2968086 RepID=UPI002016B281|nr:GNAT family N-acetyltransferase [Aeromicrobium duanguangcaii]MCL3838893.1 GNAT family N-acetyltransferase [Aeromicrobium duanguangcaii]